MAVSAMPAWAVILDSQNISHEILRSLAANSESEEHGGS
jgi:hypothetical protein